MPDTLPHLCCLQAVPSGSTQSKGVCALLCDLAARAALLHPSVNHPACQLTSISLTGSDTHAASASRVVIFSCLQGYTIQF